MTEKKKDDVPPGWRSCDLSFSVGNPVDDPGQVCLIVKVDDDHGQHYGFSAKAARVIAKKLIAAAKEADNYLQRTRH